ncbi:MAG: hypothetical protein OEY59_00070 [Deltaproteobacteria bacterium]|nr:hypothetical protein [Deltaproteobacteria bacterium]
MILRYLLIVIGCYLCYRLLKKTVGPKFFGAFKPKELDESKLVQCDNCKAHVAQKTVINKKNHCFCDDDCMKSFFDG